MEDGSARFAQVGGGASAALAEPTLLLVDDHEVVREGIRHRMEDRRLGRCVGEVGSGEEALEFLESHAPDIALVDISMPGMGGIELCAVMQQRHPDVKVVILSAQSGVRLIEKAFRHGALAYVTKEARLETFAHALESVQSGRRFVDPALTGLLLDSEGVALSDRQEQILKLIADGKQNATIAHELNISAETVKSHVSAILDRLQTQTRAGAVATALRDSLIS